MRIALVYLGRRGSGGPISLSMAEALAKEAEVLAVVSEYSESLSAWEESKIQLSVTPTYKNIFGALREWIYPATSRLICQEIRKWKPDVILFPMFFTWNPLLQRQLREIPAIVAVHDPIPHPGLTGYVFGLLERWSMRLASRVIIFSQVFISELARKGFDASRIDVIPHGDLSYYRRYQGNTSYREEVSSATTLLFFGRITAYKGLDILLKAYRNVQSQRKVALIVAGSGDLSPYQKFLSGLKSVEVHNRWLDEGEIPEIFQRARIVVLPYTSGSQSGVLALAASFGIPVIATRTGGIVEQLDDNITGILVEPNSVEELSAAIIKLIDDADAARRMGKALQKRFAEQYRWDKIGKMILEICYKVA